MSSVPKNTPLNGTYTVPHSSHTIERLPKACVYCGILTTLLGPATGDACCTLCQVRFEPDPYRPLTPLDVKNVS